MNRLAAILGAFQLVSLAASARANPMVREVLRVREVRGSHVQLTYGVDGEIPKTPTATTTFGATSTKWKTSVDYNTNTGSGVRAIKAIQMCDCNVAVGQSFEYKVTVESAFEAKPQILTASLTTTGKYDKQTPPSPSGNTGEMPWDIPDPVEVQGLDCATECSLRVPTDNAGSTSTGNGSCACSIFGGSHVSRLFVLALGLGLVGYGRRKRSLSTTSLLPQDNR